MQLVACLLVALTMALPGQLGPAPTVIVTATGVSVGPCPSSAPARAYEVVALRVPVSYNNWGDFDPHGRLFVPRADVVPLTVDVAAHLRAAGMATLGNAVEAAGAAIDDAARAPTDLLADAGSLPDPGALQGAQDDLTAAIDDVVAAGGLDPGASPVPIDRGTGVGGRLTPSVLARPYVARAHLGECVTFRLYNALPEPAGMQFAGLGARPGQGMWLASDTPDFTAPGAFHDYTVYVPTLSSMEGAHLLSSPTDPRYHTQHGLFGALVAEPAGTSWLAPDGAATPYGDQAMVTHASASDFREFVVFYHDEVELIDHMFRALPTVSPFGEYGPGSKAINLRSEPFMDRFVFHDQLNEDGVLARGHDKSQAYGSYTYGDPGIYIPKSYVGDPAKFRLTNVGPGQSHTHHLHGGGDRWRASPAVGDTQFDDGFMKTNPTLQAPSERIDVQNLAPGESYNAEIEGGSGGVQQSVGDFLFHCHIVEHYLAGMWTFWRVLNTAQPGLAALPDRTAAPTAVKAVDLIGHTMPGGSVLATKADVEAWVLPQLPAQGVAGDDDASVWDWTEINTPPSGLGVGTLKFFGEPETDIDSPNYHPASPGTRPELKFNPTDGKLAYPFLQPHFGKRPPFAPGHGPAPYLTPTVTTSQPKGLCPAGAPSRDYKIVALSTAVPYNSQQTDPDGQIFVHAADKADVLSGAKPAKSLVVRANQGDCVDFLFTSQLNQAPGAHSKVNMHVHLVQFDIQGSDGVITGLNYETSVRPAQLTSAKVASATAVGATTVSVDDAGQFKVGTTVGIGLTLATVETRKITAVSGNTLTLDAGLANTHGLNESVGYEFVKYRWYPDVELGMVYWHDHVDGLNSWRHGLFGGIVIEPAGSHWCDPKRGDSERTSCPDKLDGHLRDIVTGSGGADSYRELVVQVQDRACITDCSAATTFPNPAVGEKEPASLNLRSAPFFTRNAQDPFLSSASPPGGSGAQGPPSTDMLEAYPGDPVVVRLLYAGQASSIGVGTFEVTGHRFRFEQHADGSRTIDRVGFGEASMHNLRLECGAGGCDKQAGDYLYGMAQPDLLNRGAWGVFRVKSTAENSVSGGGLQLLPENLAPAPSTFPTATSPGISGVRSYDVVAMEVPVDHNKLFGLQSTMRIFALDTQEADIRAGILRPAPLVLRALPGEIVEVTLTNHLPAASGAHVSLSPSLVWAAPGDGYGIPIGDNSDDTVAPGGSRTYRWHADHEVGVAYITSYGNPASDGTKGLYGALVVEPPGSSFAAATGPSTTLTLSSGEQVREHVLQWASNDKDFQSSTMPYLTDIANPVTINYRSEPLWERVGGRVSDGGVTAPLGGMGLNTCQIDVANCGLDVVRQDIRNPLNPLAHAGEAPETPILDVKPGQGVVVRSLVGAGDQMMAPGIQGHWWAVDPDMTGCRQLSSTCPSNVVSSRTLGTGEADNAWIPAAGPGGPGLYLVADRRAPMHEAGAWGILRVCPAPVPVSASVNGTGIIGSGGSSLDQDIVVEAHTESIEGALECVSSTQSDAAMKVLREQVGGAFRDVVRAILAGNAGNVGPTLSNAVFNTVLQNNVCKTNTETTPGNGDTSMPPLAFLAPNIPGFIPGCVNITSDHTLTIHHRGDVPHNPGSSMGPGVTGNVPSPATRCFQFLRDKGATQAAGQNYDLKWRYNGTALLLSIDGGASWRDCTNALDPGQSDSTKAVLPFRCDIHNGMVGKVVVMAS